ncbi:S1 RNA-binding domain-containing protein, partial [Pseudomonas sivasensis]
HPYTQYLQDNDKGAIVKAPVKEVDPKGAIIVLADYIQATLKASEISRDRVEDARNVLKEGQEVEAKIISVDRKSRVIQLSIKSKDEVEEKEAIQSLKSAPEAATGETTMASLLREAMAKQN